MIYLCNGAIALSSQSYLKCTFKGAYKVLSLKYYSCSHCPQLKLFYFYSDNRSTLTSSPPSWRWTTGPRSTVTPSSRTRTRQRRRRNGFQNLRNLHQSDSEDFFADCPREIGTVVTSNKIQW